MAQWFKALAVLSEEPHSSLGTHMVTWELTTDCSSSSRCSDILFWPPQAAGTYVVHIHTLRYNINTHTNKNKKEKNKGKPAKPH